MADQAESNANDKPEISEEEPIVTTHELELDGEYAQLQRDCGQDAA